jgi:V8-like Glu-specific endopeptidase
VLLVLAGLLAMAPVASAADDPVTGATMGRPLTGTPMAALAGYAPLAGAPRASSASEGRWLVSTRKLRQRPFRGIVLVAIGRGVVCTGFIVARRKVVTAAHCLTRDAGAGDFRFRPGLPASLRIHRGFSRIAGGSSFASCRVSRVWAHARFIKSGARDSRYGSRVHDYAVLTTPSDCRYPGNAVLPLQATSAFDGQLPNGRQIRLAGYPSDPRFEGMDGLNLWRSQGEVVAGSDPATLAVTGFVAQGMSGAPVWRSYGSASPCGRTQCVVGIITECAVNGRGLCRLGDSPRRAVRITTTVKQTIRRH